VKDIFVGNLDLQTSEDELRQLFAAYGAVNRVSIVTDRYSGQPRGSAFVEMASAGDADKAITELNGTQLHGRTLDVNEARRWPERTGSGRKGAAGDVFRARLILALADGIRYREIARSLKTSGPTIARWKIRFEQEGVAVLEGRHQGSKPRAATPVMQARVIRRVQQKPGDGSTHWSCRKLAHELGLSKSTVQRILAQAQLQPQRLERDRASHDPDFEAKAADIIGLYLDPPQHAAVFCVDEKTAIQALDRLDPVLPLSPGQAERHGFEYYRHGTLSLYAASEVKTGKVEGKTAKRHTSAEFLAFLEQLLDKARWAKEIHIVLDNLSAHKTKAVEEFLVQHPKLRFHFTPTYSSWLIRWSCGSPRSSAM
jgi:transposase